MAEPLDGNTVQRYKNLACEENIWLSLGGIHESVNSTISCFLNLE